MNIALEWNTVKELPSLLKHYGNQNEYQKWRQRFIRKGYLQPKHRKKKRTREDKLAYNRSYYKKWRANNRDKVEIHNLNYWSKKIKSIQDANDGLKDRQKRDSY
jgi:hypothetical protein